MQIPSAFQPPRRLLMGPGPSDVAPSVLKSMSLPLLGHLDPVCVTGSAGMEFCFVNLLEPGDEVVIGVNGVFGGRMVDVAERCGARVIKVESPWGRIIEPQQIEEAVKNRRPKLVAMVHAETSTGALTPAEEISKIAHRAGALMLLDTVTSLGG